MLFLISMMMMHDWMFMLSFDTKWSIKICSRSSSARAKESLKGDDLKSHRHFYSIWSRYFGLNKEGKEKRIIMLAIARQFHWVAAVYMTLRHFHDVKLQKKESEHYNICAHGRKISNGVMYYFMAWAAIKRMKCLISFPVQ